MYTKESILKEPRAGCLKMVLYYALLCFSGFIFMPIFSVAAKVKKQPIKGDQVEQKKNKTKKEKKSKSVKGEKKTCDIIAYTSLSLENLRKLAKYGAFYHQGSHCIGLNIDRIDITSSANIMFTIYCGRRLKKFAKDSEKTTCSLVKRYYVAQSLAKHDFQIYQDYKKNQGNHGSAEYSILTNILTNAITDLIQASRFKKQDIIFDRMVPYMIGLSSIKKQVKLSKINVVMLATQELTLPESSVL